MICEKYSDLIEDLLEDELDERLSAKMAAHVLACQECTERYETLRRAKEIYAQYLFDAEPPPNSWLNFQTRLIEEKEKASGNASIPVNSSRLGRKGIFVFSFTPAFAGVAAALFLICGIGFIWLQFKSVENDVDKYAGKMTTENSLIDTRSQETDSATAADRQAKTVAARTGDAPKNHEMFGKHQSFKTVKSSSLSRKKSVAAVETMKITQKVFSSDKRKSARESRPDQEKRLTVLQAQNLEMEIAVQMEKIELLLRSFRNARSNETAEGFDIEYEKRQARKLLDKNAQLKSRAENYGLSYSEELLSRVEAYLLEIANLEINPTKDRVLDIKNRVSNQNIIASLQVYRRDESQ